MKRHAAFFKNIAALVMLIALLSLLLPFCKITTNYNTTTVSGLEVLKIGADAGYEYYSNGEIGNNYVLWENLTWGEIKGGITTSMESSDLQKVAVCIVIASLPVVFCFLSMLFTFMATGKKTMILPTLFIAFTFLENVALILLFFNLQKDFAPYVNITLLVGIYGFTILSGIALGILLLLWVTGGFRKPEKEERNSSRKKKKGEKWDKYKRSNHSGRKRRKRHKRRKKNQKSDKKEKTNKTNQENDREDDNTFMLAKGYITGLDGIYQGIRVDLTRMENSILTLGTTQEAEEAILNGTMNQLDRVARHNCVIAYSRKSKQYRITSHSMTEIRLKLENENGAMIWLREEDSVTVGPKTLLYVEGGNHCIRLE